MKKFGIRGKPINISESESASSGTVSYNNCTSNQNILSNSADCTGDLERTASAAGNSSSNDRERSLIVDRDRGSPVNERSTSERAGNDRLSVVTGERKSFRREHGHAGSGDKISRFKRSTSRSSESAPPAKKTKLLSSLRDVTLSEASKYASKDDYYFFNKVSIIIY